jgi:hypothetical protein
MGVKAVKKLALSIVVLACVFLFSPKPTRAASELENWCLAVGAAWGPNPNECTISGAAAITTSLTVLQGETIRNRGNFYIEGTIDNEGYIDNEGTLVNDNTINNSSNGTINNYSDGAINNYGTFNNDNIINNDGSTINNYNYGTIDNEGFIFNNSSISNYGIINNEGDIENDGTINNYCPGIIIGNPPVGNPIVDICFEIFLPNIGSALGPSEPLTGVGVTNMSNSHLTRCRITL